MSESCSTFSCRRFDGDGCSSSMTTSSRLMDVGGFGFQVPMIGGKDVVIWDDDDEKRDTDLSYVAILRFMVEVCWGLMLAAFNATIDQSDDRLTTSQCILGFRYVVHVTAVIGMQIQRNDFVTYVAKFTFLHCAAYMKQKNVDVVKKGTLQNPAVMAVIQGVHMIAALSESIVQDWLNSEAIVAFVKALCKVSMSELQSPKDPRVFSLIKLIEIAASISLLRVPMEVLI
ncbi:hypothetical protein F3Y22_tig00116971pilonHSYRG00445 [Hibiscus syriacus]|uniref:Uncharacterized protein n=1 Tax=Hibiscus syriacus TaxID=106335 RepID=A0A6A2WSF7_HIBSY|nr:hypothetical protein F3Y22_tig00116971pilonHSYRG00445 [Hibiscus syriacus]